MKTLTLTIDGRKVEAPQGATVLEAAQKAGIHIPTLCHDADLEPYGGCRLCIVEIDGMRGLVPSCTTRAADNMNVRTETPDIVRARRMTIELLIADHPQDCLSCTSNQRCELQKMASFLGVDRVRLRRGVRDIPKDTSNPFFTRDMSKCVLCAKCVRACREIRCIEAIDVSFRGYDSRISAFGDAPIYPTVCTSCGECVDRCPTGALSANSEALPPTSTVKTVCPYCGCGCGIALGVRSGKVVRIQRDLENEVNLGSLCVKGRFGMDFIHSPDRLTKPLIRKDGALKEASWDEALELVARRFGEIRGKHGPDALAGLASAKCTNEENYLMQKLVRVAFGTNNIDHCARLCHASTVAGLVQAFGSGAMTNSIRDIAQAKCFLIIGSNPMENHPIIGAAILRAVTRGAKLIFCDPRQQTELTRHAVLHLRQKCGTNVALLNGMMNVIVSKGLHDTQFIAARTEGFDELKKTLATYTPDRVEGITGVPAADIEKAAELYATSGAGMIFFAMGVTQHTTGTDGVLSVANLAMLTGNIGREGAGVNPLRGQNNVQGACDVGCLPNLYPGYQPVRDAAAREKFEKAWGARLDGKAGLTVVEIMNAAARGEMKGVYIMGENPVISDPDSQHVCEALKKLEFLVVQDIFLTETARFAHVVLPAACFAEKDGTVTNTERRVQLMKQAVAPPGQARPDWKILCDVASRLGCKCDFASPAEIMKEIGSLVPSYAGVSHARLEHGGIQWPCTGPEHPGMPILHREKFTRGLGKFHAVEFKPSAELPDAEFPLVLTTGRILQHYHTGTMTRRSEGLNYMVKGPYVEINPADAEKSGVENGASVSVASRRGKICVEARVTRRVPAGTVFIPFHFCEGAANVLTNTALDPVAKIPELKVCAVSIVKT